VAQWSDSKIIRIFYVFVQDVNYALPR
jgi:hypothetical protein